MPIKPKRGKQRITFEAKQIQSETRQLIICAKEMIAESRSIKAELMQSVSSGINDVLGELQPIRQDIGTIKDVLFGIPADPNSPGVVHELKAMKDRHGVYDNFIRVHEEMTKLQAVKQEGVRLGVKNVGISREFALKLWQLIIGGLAVILTSTVIQTIIEAIFKAGGKP